MAVQFFNGKSHKNKAPVPPELNKKAVEAAKTYDWTENPEEVPEHKRDDLSANPDDGSYPRQFVCKKTGLTATKMEEESHVLFVKGELLVFSADETMVKDIIT